MEIDIESLKKIFELILRKLEEEGVTNVIVDKDDYYWLIGSNEWRDMTKVTEKPEVGSFSDDWESLLKIVDEEYPVTFVDFDRCAAILRLISDEVNPIEERS
jgi:hypothetical protein